MSAIEVAMRVYCAVLAALAALPLLYLAWACREARRRRHPPRRTPAAAAAAEDRYEAL